MIDIKTSMDVYKHEIAGVISLAGRVEDLDYIASNNIPIVDVLGVLPTPYPLVTFDFSYFHEEIIEIIKRNGCTKVLIFSLALRKDSVRNLYSSYPFQLEDFIFSDYDNNRISYGQSEDNGEEEIVNILDNIKEKPDMVVFLDDNLFKITSEYFDDYPHIFKDTPIITHSNINWSYTGKYNITRLEFDLYEMGKATMELLEGIIQNKPLIEYNKIIRPKLIPSEYKKRV